MTEWQEQTEALVEEIAGGSTRTDKAFDLEVETFVSDDEDGIERELQDLVTTVEVALPVEGLHLDEELVKNNLEELLLVLIGLHGGTHGKQLMSDISRLTDVQLSPGTLYPVLHDLESRDLLSMHKRVRTKAYTVNDRDGVIGQLERSMIEHLSFGILQYAFLAKFRQS